MGTSGKRYLEHLNVGFRLTLEGRKPVNICKGMRMLAKNSGKLEEEPDKSSTQALKSRLAEINQRDSVRDCVP